MLSNNNRLHVYAFLKDYVFFFNLGSLKRLSDNSMNKAIERTSIGAVDRADIYPVRRQIPASLPLVILL